jgi:hypothetical protein
MSGNAGRIEPVHGFNARTSFRGNLSMNHNLSVAVWENKRRHNPVGVDEIVCESTQGSLARSATPGFGAQSLWDWTNKSAREKHSIWFMVGEQVRMEQATFHEPRKMTHAHPSP